MGIYVGFNTSFLGVSGGVIREKGVLGIASRDPRFIMGLLSWVFYGYL